MEGIVQFSRPLSDVQSVLFVTDETDMTWTDLALPFNRILGMFRYS